MSYLVSFLPWIAFAVVPSKQWLLAALLGFGVGAVLLIRGFVAGRRIDMMVIEASAAIYFGLVALLALIDPTSPIQHYVPPMSDAWLTLTALGSILVKRPFTMGIAKTQAPEHVWNTPRFYRINLVITSVWTAAFALTGLTLLLMPATGRLLIAVKVAGFVLPGLFTVWYVKRLRRGIPAQEGQTA